MWCEKFALCSSGPLCCRDWGNLKKSYYNPCLLFSVPPVFSIHLRWHLSADPPQNQQPVTWPHQRVTWLAIQVMWPGWLLLPCSAVSVQAASQVGSRECGWQSSPDHLWFCYPDVWTGQWHGKLNSYTVVLAWLLCMIHPYFKSVT